MSEYGRIIGIDVGTKCTGLARTDLLRTSANPIGTYDSQQVFDELERLIYNKNEKVIKLVVGWPLTPDGNEGNATERVEKFITKLRARFPNIEIEKMDERYTSKEAVQAMIEAGVPKMKRREKERIDQAAAAIILQKYLQISEYWYMAVLPIVTYDDDILHKETKPVTENSDELQALIDDMFETMYNADGVGLAAPQVGQLVRVFVTDADAMIDEADQVATKYGPLTMINPEIVKASDQKVEMEEGCLSIPGVNAVVKRPEKIKVQYLDRDFNEQELNLDGWLSRVVQHEKDHLDGVLFLEHLSFFKQKLLSSKLNEIAKGEKETQYPLAPKKQVEKKE